MEIGDRVRLLHGKEEGIIRRFIDHKTVEIEIEEGFLIPVLKRELVTIDRLEHENKAVEERSRAGRTEPSQEYIPEGDEEIYLALEIKHSVLDLWLINHTRNGILFTAHLVAHDQVRGIAFGTLKKFSHSKLDTWNLKDQERWSPLVVDILPFTEKRKEQLPVISRTITIRNNLLTRGKTRAPLLNQDAVLVSLSEKIPALDPEKLKSAFFEKKSPEITRPKDGPGSGREKQVDLHIESLMGDAHGLDNETILKIQLAHFEKNLEKALIENLNAITFIHGIGNGTLRHQIHKFLASYPHIQYFEDAQKGKFGYAATKVIFK